MISQDNDKQPNNISADALQAGLERVQRKQRPDEKDTLEKTWLENEMLKEEINNLKADRELRRDYADKIISYLIAYSLIVGAIVVVDGIARIPFDLPDLVLATLVGTTAAAAIGLVGFVAKGLFNSS